MHQNEDDKEIDLDIEELTDLLREPLNRRQSDEILERSLCCGKEEEVNDELGSTFCSFLPEPEKSMDNFVLDDLSVFDDFECQNCNLLHDASFNTSILPRRRTRANTNISEYVE